MAYKLKSTWFYKVTIALATITRPPYNLGRKKPDRHKFIQCFSVKVYEKNPLRIFL